MPTAHEIAEKYAKEGCAAELATAIMKYAQGHINSATEDERDACAAIADERALWARKMFNSNYRAMMADHIANEIRRRKLLEK